MITDLATTYIAYQEGIPHDEVPEWLDQWAETIEGKTAELATNLKTFFSRGITVNFDLDHHDKETTMTTETFTASNGIEIEISQDRYLLGNGDYGSGPTYATAGPEGIDALREYFQAERDTELGRWRDPEAPDVVVYHLPSAKREATGRTVRVLDERLGAAAICNEHLERSSDPTNAEPTANRYFAAHPEPKPWQDAKPGEVWVLDLGNGPGRESPATVNTYPEFRTAAGNYLSLNDPSILHATRIWPEESDDE